MHGQWPYVGVVGVTEDATIREEGPTCTVQIGGEKHFSFCQGTNEAVLG